MNIGLVIFTHLSFPHLNHPTNQSLNGLLVFERRLPYSIKHPTKSLMSAYLTTSKQTLPLIFCPHIAMMRRSRRFGTSTTSKNGPQPLSVSRTGLRIISVNGKTWSKNALHPVHNLFLMPNAKILVTTPTSPSPSL